tara:strand:+ start:489 stop:1148 length:660 start_codon:yes stop_codon:yes gene_type:complete
MQKFSLNYISIVCGKEDSVKNCIILFHGYGGDGKDISTLAYGWKRHLDNTIIICPDGHEMCSINPSGRQWFDLSVDDPDYILEKAISAEKKISYFINEIKNFYKLENKNIYLAGFSQGCMISLNLAFGFDEAFNSIIGFSGKIIDKNYLSKKIKNNSRIFLIHGDKDDIVHPSNLLDAKDFFIRHKININTKIIENCGHNISAEASTLALKFIKENLNK